MNACLWLRASWFPLLLSSGWSSENYTRAASEERSAEAGAAGASAATAPHKEEAWFTAGFQVWAGAL